MSNLYIFDLLPKSSYLLQRSTLLTISDPLGIGALEFTLSTSLFEVLLQSLLTEELEKRWS